LGDSRLGLSCCDHRIGKPNQQAAALTQHCIVASRVRATMSLIGNVMATLGTGFERHDNDSEQ